MIPVRQVFPATPVVDIVRTVRRGFEPLLGRLRPGQNVAVAVGSRGITRLRETVVGVLEVLRWAGVRPYIVPAMGSHGGATPEGQTELLKEYGVDAASLGVPIHAAMEAECIGETPDGVKVFFAREALKADAVVVINRVKPHTDFAGVIGSGLQKMLVIGLGKRTGAANFHLAALRLGYEHVIRSSAKVTLERVPVLCGVALVEDARHQPAIVEVVPAKMIPAREEQLFAEAARVMPRLPFPGMDLLIVDRIGKNISGAGMDPNVIGRGVHGYSSAQIEPSTPGQPVIRRLFVRDITPESHGNAIGIGMADVTTTRLVREMDARVTAINALTALTVQSAKIPIHFESDREAIAACLESAGLTDTAAVRVVRIESTLSLEHVQVSESYAEEVAANGRLESKGPPREMSFDTLGNLADSLE
jgi:hypothetical protein